MSRDLLDTLKHARDFYHIKNWAEKYFSINKLGHMEIHPWQNALGFDLHALVQNLKSHNLHPPYILRFPDIIRQRVSEIQNAFSNAILKYNYPECYMLAYPFKVNYSEKVLSTINNIQSEANTPLAVEVGSKGELLIVLAKCPQNTTIICNGYKDIEFLNIAMMAKRFGHKLIVVIEKPHELKLFHKVFQNCDPPDLGLRLQLGKISLNNWQVDSDFDPPSKFGLNDHEFLEALQFLKENNLLSKITLLHCHIDSNLSSLKRIHLTLKELVSYYKHLFELGINLEWFDIGGGLAIDYNGMHSESESSREYSIGNYADLIVETLSVSLKKFNLPTVGIITESGRAITAHHAIVITELLDFSPIIVNNLPCPTLPKFWLNVISDIEQRIKNLQNSVEGENINLLLKEKKFKLNNSFLRGQISLPQKIQINECLNSFKIQLNQKIRLIKEDHQPTNSMNSYTPKIGYLNFSLFQSLPDSWGCGQIFPCLPLNNLNGPLTNHFRLADLSCDSDGILKKHAQGQKTFDFLTLPKFKDDEPSIIGFFLVGAYQENLAMNHNLFSHTAIIECSFINDEISVESITPPASVLDTMQVYGYTEHDLLKQLKNKTSQVETDNQLRDKIIQDIQLYFSETSYLKSW